MLVLGRERGQGVTLTLPDGRAIGVRVAACGEYLEATMPQGVAVSMDIVGSNVSVVRHRIAFRCRNGGRPFAICAELVLQPQGLRVRIDAPRDVVILRDELVDQKGGARC